MDPADNSASVGTPLASRNVPTQLILCCSSVDSPDGSTSSPELRSLKELIFVSMDAEWIPRHGRSPANKCIAIELKRYS